MWTDNELFDEHIERLENHPVSFLIDRLMNSSLLCQYINDNHNEIIYRVSSYSSSSWVHTQTVNIKVHYTCYQSATRNNAFELPFCLLPWKRFPSTAHKGLLIIINNHKKREFECISSCSFLLKQTATMLPPTGLHKNVFTLLQYIDVGKHPIFSFCPKRIGCT